VITASTSLQSLRLLQRLDAWYFLAPGAAASRSLEKAKTAGLDTLRLGGKDGLGHVWAPARFKRAYAAEGESALPYLAPHDVFEYLPEPSSWLSATRTKNLDKYRVKPGMVLQTCSGRNLGPSVIVDATLSTFVMSHDLVRIEVSDARMRNFVVGFLHSKTGQGLLRRDKSGSVIDHITADHVAAQEIPLLADEVIDRVSTLIGGVYQLVAEARGFLSEALKALEAQLPHPMRKSPAKQGWSVSTTNLTGRLDATSYDPWVQSIRRGLLEMGGVPMRDVATVLKPSGRYTTYYVGREYGLPILSGTQVLQSALVKPQFMSPRAFKDVTKYELREGWSAYMADGRAEKGLGVVAYITPDREGWLGSGHVGRLVPKEGTNPGALWLAARTMHVRAQINALASGSVVDSTFPEDEDSEILPPLDSLDGDAIVAAWRKYSDASGMEQEAVEIIDREMGEVSGVDQALIDQDLTVEAPSDDPDVIEDFEAETKNDRGSENV
jgi:hypothetical protein